MVSMMMMMVMKSIARVRKIDDRHETHVEIVLEGNKGVKARLFLNLDLDTLLLSSGESKWDERAASTNLLIRMMVAARKWKFRSVGLVAAIEGTHNIFFPLLLSSSLLLCLFSHFLLLSLYDPTSPVFPFILVGIGDGFQMGSVEGSKR